MFLPSSTCKTGHCTYTEISPYGTQVLGASAAKAAADGMEALTGWFPAWAFAPPEAAVLLFG
jgi:hypothetical protein